MKTFKDIIKWSITCNKPLKEQLVELFDISPSAALRWQIARTTPVVYKDFKGLMNFNLYTSDDSMFIELVDDEGPIMVMTVCLNQNDLEEDVILVKDYAENAGITLALIDAGIIFPDSVDTFNSGFVTIESYRLKL